jgi:hypothetical protein
MILEFIRDCIDKADIKIYNKYGGKNGGGNPLLARRAGIENPVRYGKYISAAKDFGMTDKAVHDLTAVMIQHPEISMLEVITEANV